MTRTTDGNRSQVKRYGYRWWWLILLASYLTASCVMSPRGRQLGRHHWNGDRGPVVPHDSFPADCTLCHERGNWSKLRSDFQFDHARETGVPLIGAHGQAQCLRCHNDRGPVSVFARRGCSGCHDDVHRGQLGIRCGQCHNEDNWVPQGQIALHNRTRFPLVGAHTAVACFRCHPGAPVGNLVRAPVECAACHQQALARAKNPDHVAQGWTHDCDRCHQPITWSGATFHHTRFPLTGAHRAVACTDCHTNGTFAAMPHDCVSCHLADFQSTRNPDHVAGNFSTDCQSCHNTVSWQGARFNHNGITNNCDRCHSADYNNTTNPSHIAAGFPRTCEMCHNTFAWRPANFNHTFNINSGPHKNYTCAECHQVPTNYSIVSCTHCHEHAQSPMNNKHSGVNGYSWSSPACINCHPQGKK